MLIQQANHYDLKFILDEISFESEQELKILAGENYKKKVYDEVIKNDFDNIFTVYFKNIPVAISGLIVFKDDVYSLFFISSKMFKSVPKLYFLKESKNYIEKWKKKFAKIIDTVYEKNISVIKWVEWLGFQKIGRTIDNFIVYEL